MPHDAREEKRKVNDLIGGVVRTCFDEVDSRQQDQTENRSFQSKDIVKVSPFAGLLTDGLSAGKTYVARNNKSS